MDRGMNGGVTFVAIFGGSLFFTCSDRERGRNADKWLKGKDRIKLREETKFKLIETHRCVCVCRVCAVGKNGRIRRERREIQSAENHKRLTAKHKRWFYYNSASWFGAKAGQFVKNINNVDSKLVCDVVCVHVCVLVNSFGK